VHTGNQQVFAGGLGENRFRVALACTGSQSKAIAAAGRAA
jgi:hypothetical protein